MQIQIFIDSFLNLLYISIINFLYTKYRKKMDPVHILEINILIDQFTIISNVALRHLVEGQLGEGSWACKIINIVSFAATWSFYLGICLTQIGKGSSWNHFVFVWVLNDAMSTIQTF